MTFNPDAEADKVLRQADSLVIALECLACEFVTELVIRPESVSHALNHCNELRSRCDYLARELSTRLVSAERNTVLQAEPIEREAFGDDLLAYVEAVSFSSAPLHRALQQ